MGFTQTYVNFASCYCSIESALKSETSANPGAPTLLVLLLLLWVIEKGRISNSDVRD